MHHDLLSAHDISPAQHVSRADAASKQGAIPFAGLFFTLLGVTFVFLGRSYAVGSANQIGPGVFPIILGAALALLGVGVAIVEWQESVPREKFAGWPLVVTLGSVLLFALLLERAGFLLAAPVLIVGGCLAARETRPLRVAIITVAVTAGAAGLFNGLLGVSFPLLP